MKHKPIEVQSGGSAKIATGSYVGTGTYGADNPTVIEIPFEPRFLAITRSDNNNPAYNFYVGGAKTLITYLGSTITYATVSYSSPHFAFYGGLPGEQCNTKDGVYAWVALGE